MIEQYIVYKKISDSDMELLTLPVNKAEIKNYISSAFDERDQDHIQYCEHGLFIKLYPIHYKQMFDNNRFELMKIFFDQRRWVRFNPPSLTEYNELNYNDWFLIYENNCDSFIICFHINCPIEFKSRLFYETMTYLKQLDILLFEGESFCRDLGEDLVFDEKALRFHLFYKNFNKN